MHPILFSIGHVHAYGYGFMIAVGALLAVFVSEFRANRRGLNGDLVFKVALWGLFAGLVGAKLTYIASNFPLLFTDPKYVLGTYGFTVYGGVVLGILVGAVLLRREKADIPVYMDLIIPQIALVQGFGRIGCFLAGCCYGKPTTHVFGVTFPPEAIAPSGISLIPTQLLSSAGDFLIFLVLVLISDFGTDHLRLSPKKDPDRRSFFRPLSISGLYLVLYGIGRFVIEFLRMDPRRVLAGLTSNQYVSLLFLAAGLFLILKRFRTVQEKIEA